MLEITTRIVTGFVSIVVTGLACAQIVAAHAGTSLVPESALLSGELQINPLQNPSPTTNVPDSLSATDWALIHSQIESGNYRAYENQHGDLVSANPRYGWSVRYAADGTTTLRQSDGYQKPYQLGFRLTAIGHEDLLPLGNPLQVTAEESKVTYQWNDHIREWWTNSESGLEQWFQIAQRPPGASSRKPLTLEMTLATDLKASQHSEEIRFSNNTGTTITYDKLKAWDASGLELQSRMQIVADKLSLIIEDAEATYPITIDPTVSQQAYLKASNTETGDQFGYSVAISGDTVAVGAYLEDSNANGVNGDQSDNSANWAGAVYVFTRSGTVWTQQAYLKASNSDANDKFGVTVSISGDTLVVGAVEEDSAATGVNGNHGDNSANNAGAAYVFVRSGSAWTQQAYLKAPQIDESDKFGVSVAVSGDTVVVGAEGDDSNATGVNGNPNNTLATNSGAAYVFTRNGTSWTQQAYLKASNPQSGDVFGHSVAISGDTVAVGAYVEDSNATGVNGNQNNDLAPWSGAVYVFHRSGTTWAQQAYLKASNTNEYDMFGVSVAASGNTLVVGAAEEDSNATSVNGIQSNNSATSAGAAYVFTRSGTVWTQQAYLKASNTDAEDKFGYSVGISGDTIVVGAAQEASNATSVNGNQSDNSAFKSGAAYSFTRSGTVWTQQDYLKASNTNASDHFGWAVANAGDTIVATAPWERSNATGVNGNQGDNSLTTAGAAYVFDDSSDLSHFSVGGTVSGLAGTGLVLKNNGGNNLPISANGSFTFSTPLPVGSNYAVTVWTQPGNPTQTCNVSNGSGVIGGSNITNVLVTCSTTTYTVGGSVSGLAGTGLVLKNNGGNNLPISANGSFTFSTPLPVGSNYAVTVWTQPGNPTQTCNVSNGSGVIGSSNITNIAVNCSGASFTIGGTVEGNSGSGLVLQNNGGNNLPISGNGSFTFGTPLPDGSAYAVTIRSQPNNPNRTCGVSNGSGVVDGANVTSVRVICSTQTYTIGGSVSGLSGSGMVLQNNGGDNLQISGNGSFTFGTPLPNGTDYAVTVWTQPGNPTQTCSVSNGNGVIGGANITSVMVSCNSDMIFPANGFEN